LLGIAASAGAQSSQPQRGGGGATISGVVYDSIAHAPLDGATIQLVSADGSSRVARSAESDSLGHYVVANLPAGRYSVGFFHPVLETLGIEPPLRPISVEGNKPMRVDLGTPGVPQYRAAVCGPEYAARPGAIIVGIVRDARDLSALPATKVTAQWMEMTFTKNGTVRKFPSAAATTAPNGWFALCDLPSPGTISLLAARGADSLERLEVDIPETGVVRKELYFAPSARASDGRIFGTVLTAEGGRPVVGAKVAISGGPETRTNDRGEWTIIGAPYGTRVMEVRAIGFYPDRRPVNVIAEAAPVRVKLSTMRAVLDTIKVSASRVAYDASGFMNRRRAGNGKFFTAQEIDVRGGVVTSDIFRSVPGLTVERDPNTGEPAISMRGPFGYCGPTVFLNGNRLPGIHAGDIDDIVSLKEVKGVEIYSEASVPGEFKDFTRMDSCGSIVIWTK
jgi:hypothetical protein